MYFSALYIREWIKRWGITIRLYVMFIKTVTGITATRGHSYCHGNHQNGSIYSLILKIWVATWENTFWRVRNKDWSISLHICAVWFESSSQPQWLSWMPVWLVIKRLWVRPLPGRQHSFVKIDHEIFSTVILTLLLIQGAQLSVSWKKMWTKLVNHLED